jgi:hypothetical protein
MEKNCQFLIPANLGELVGPGAIVGVVGNGKYLPA